MLDEQRPDGVLVCVNSSFHAKVSLELMEMGYHVYVEKPMTRTSAEGKVYGAKQCITAEEALRAWTLGVTYRLTEFQLWRLEWQRVGGLGNGDQNFLTLQFKHLIGAHPAHRY